MTNLIKGNHSIASPFQTGFAFERTAKLAPMLHQIPELHYTFQFSLALLFLAKAVCMALFRASFLYAREKQAIGGTREDDRRRTTLFGVLSPNKQFNPLDSST